jgi:pimeloyl-ACP methyl ester carboxylesterase
MARKGFVEVDGRMLHYVRMGDGPAVVLLHASPCSAKVMAPLQSILALRFTTFAFDLPGFGLSDPPAGTTVETWQLADAIAGAIRALGLEQVAAYGRHTGAGVAVEMARRHPALISMVLTDGFPVFAQPYSDERLADYLPPIVPRWDGGHLTWTWFRYREQHIFWPWDRSAAAHRADTEVPDLDFLHRGTVELLEARAYREVYASAFRHPGLAMIGEVTVPVCYGNRPGDSQHKTMKLYPETAWVKAFPRDHLEAAAQECRVLARHPAQGTVPPHQSRISPGTSATDYVTTRSGQGFAIVQGADRPGLPLVVLHDLPGSAVLHADWIASMATHRPVLAPDLGGNGHSEAEMVGVAQWAGEIEDLLAAADIGRAAIFAIATSAAVGVELAARRPDLVAGLLLQSPPLVPPDWADRVPNIAPSADGGHLLRLWHHLRDQELWFPWFATDPAHARSVEPRIAPAALQARAVAMLRQPRHYRPIWQAVLGYRLAEAIVRVTVPIAIAWDPQDIFAPCRDRAASLSGTAPLELGDDPAAVVDAWISIVAGADTGFRAASGGPEGTAHARA